MPCAWAGCSTADTPVVAAAPTAAPVRASIVRRVGRRTGMSYLLSRYLGSACVSICGIIAPWGDVRDRAARDCEHRRLVKIRLRAPFPLRRMASITPQELTRRPVLDIRAILMGMAFAVMWSSAFTSARIIVADAPPLLALALRFALSGALAVLIARWMGQSWRLTRSQWKATIIFGICQNALYLGLNFVAMQRIEASLAAIIASSMPLLVAAANWLVFGERVPALGIFGLF